MRRIISFTIFDLFSFNRQIFFSHNIFLSSFCFTTTCSGYYFRALVSLSSSQTDRGEKLKIFTLISKQSRFWRDSTITFLSAVVPLIHIEWITLSGSLKNKFRKKVPEKDNVQQVNETKHNLFFLG